MKVAITTTFETLRYTVSEYEGVSEEALQRLIYGFKASSYFRLYLKTHQN